MDHRIRYRGIYQRVARKLAMNGDHASPRAVAKRIKKSCHVETMRLYVETLNEMEAARLANERYFDEMKRNIDEHEKN